MEATKGWWPKRIVNVSFHSKTKLLSYPRIVFNRCTTVMTVHNFHSMKFRWITSCTQSFVAESTRAPVSNRGACAGRHSDCVDLRPRHYPFPTFWRVLWLARVRRWGWRSTHPRGWIGRWRRDWSRPIPWIESVHASPSRMHQPP